MHNSDGSEKKKLVLSKTTLRNLSVRSGIRTGLSGPGCVEPTDAGAQCDTDDCGGGGGGDDGGGDPIPTETCRGRCGGTGANTAG
jgi:hypothetical protein